MSSSGLNKKSRDIVRSLIEVVKPRKPGFDLPIEDFMLDFLDNFYRRFPFHMKLLFPVGLYLLEFGTFIFEGKPKAFSKLSLPAREKYVQGWVDSKLPIRRDLIKGVKGVVLTAFYSHPEGMAHIGYDLPAHIERVNKGEPADAEACEFFKSLNYEQNSKIPYAAYDNATVTNTDNPTTGK